MLRVDKRGRSDADIPDLVIVKRPRGTADHIVIEQQAVGDVAAIVFRRLHARSSLKRGAMEFADELRESRVGDYFQAHGQRRRESLLASRVSPGTGMDDDGSVYYVRDSTLKGDEMLLVDGVDVIHIDDPMIWNELINNEDSDDSRADPDDYDSNREDNDRNDYPDEEEEDDFNYYAHDDDDEEEEDDNGMVY